MEAHDMKTRSDRRLILLPVTSGLLVSGHVVKAALFVLLTIRLNQHSMFIQPQVKSAHPQNNVRLPHYGGTKHRRGLTGHSERSSCILADPWHHGVEWALETSWRQVSA